MRNLLVRLLVLVVCIGGFSAAAPGQSLTTTTADNGTGGIFLDLTPGASPLLFTSFATYFGGAAGAAVQVEVWTRPGSYVGFDASSAGWTLTQTVSGTQAGTAALATINLTTSIVLPAGQTTGICLQSITAGGGIRYKGTGTTTQTTYSNADVTLFSSVGRVTAIAFTGSAFTPRCFAGTIFYQPADPNATGACCLSSGACQFGTVADCTAASGSFRGTGVLCADANCPLPTACCDTTTGACSIVLGGSCPATATTGGSGLGFSCSPTPCPLGACCSADGSACNSRTRAQCVSESGVHRGDGVACGSIACGAGFGEVEPNENKANADANDLFVLTGPGNYIRGNSTGTATTAGAATSLDQFRLGFPARALGIYRNRLTIDTYVAAGHTGTIRGWNQTAAGAGVWPACGAVGTPGTTDSAVQTSATTTTPARFNQWYSFGKQEEIYYRVTGAAATTGDYFSIWTVDPVTPTAIGQFIPGTITITTVGQGHTTDTDLWVYDAMFNAIDGFGNEDASTNGGASASVTTSSWLRRTYAPGTYYLALSNANLATNKGAPCDDNTRTGLLLDFPNALANSSTTANVNVAFAVTDSAGTTQFPATRAGPYDVLWFTFTVADPTGACCANNGGCSVGAASACAAPSLFQGAATTCSGSGGTCPNTVSACCDNTTGACTFVNGTACAANATNQGAGSACSPSPCTPIGICCSTLGACTQIFGGACPSGSSAGTGTTCSGNPCSAPPNVCQGFDSTTPGGLPTDWSSATVAGAVSTGGTCQPTGWSAVNDQSNSGPNAVFANNPDRTFSQELTMPAVTASGSVTLDLWARWNTENTTGTAFDGWTVEVSINGGPFANIQPTPADPNPWVTGGYNGTISTGFNSQIAGQRAFFGNSGGGAVPAWVEQTAVIAANAGDMVQFKFRMVSDSSVGCPASYAGVWLDDICIYNVSVPPSGVCCRGSTCNTTITSAANCTVASGALAGAFFNTAGSTCNSGPVSNSPCCYANYNKVSGITVQDIFDFLADWFAGRAYAKVGGDGSAGPLTVQNIFDFLGDWFAGGCN